MEKTIHSKSGWLMLTLDILLLAGGIFLLVDGINKDILWMKIAGPVILLTFFIILVGFMAIEPNSSRVLNLFGEYTGTVKDSGFFWTNPFYSRKNISLRANNMDTEPIKVNDKHGNPIMIGAVVVWRVKDTFKAAFGVDNYQSFVKTQSEAAIRKLAGSFAYDNFEHETEEITLRSNSTEVSDLLEQEVSERLAIAGIEVIETRLSHLAYATEIAGAMLQRQQATAIIAARSKIVEGAVGMVEMALESLSKNNVVQLDEERKAAMVSNLMVVLCSERSATPVLNTGSLY
ncbi:MAG: SPFH domain-containing protein [Chitinophagaceae bacterium]|jgi:regulator of protease activity HflC (stomatin/prohibitin superfamily)|nr:SPFH domain-containing protein [Chitinophagaceae bacterium]